MFRSVVSIFTLLILPSLGTAQDRWPDTFDWGHVTTHDSAIHLHVTSPPDDGAIRVPRLYNSYEKLYLQSDAAKTALKFKPEVDHWLIMLPRDRGDDSVVIMETVGKPRYFKDVPAITPNQDGSIAMPAALANVHGEKLRFEPQPHKNTVGYWTAAEDWCEWRIDVPAAGTYVVQIWQGCGKGQGGSEVEIRTAKSRLRFTVEDTGHFQNFKKRNVGQLDLQAGKQTLQIRPRVKAKNAVMDVRLVVLEPVKH